MYGIIHLHAHIKLKELFEEPREPFGHLRLFLTNWTHFGSPERAIRGN